MFLFLLAVAHCSATSIHVSTKELHGLSEWVTVEWKTDASDAVGCWIGLFAPADGNLTIVPVSHGSTYGDMPSTATAPVKYIACEDAERVTRKGAGSHRFRVLNMRVDVVFALFTNGTHVPVLLARSPVLTFKSTELPMHVHLARTASPADMGVTWTSRSAAGAKVEWGLVSGSYTSSAEANSRRYLREDLCGPPGNKEGWFDPGLVHHALISPLPDTGTVYYRVGNTAGGWSSERSFLAPAQAGSDGEVYFLVTGDVGATEPDSCTAHWSQPIGGGESQSNVTIKHLTDAKQASAVLHIGDLSYATGYLAKWELFMTLIEPVAGRTPYMTVQGNHERDWPGTGTIGGEDSGGECGVPTQTRFVMPTPSHKQESGWYAFEEGSVLIVMMDTELPCGKGSSQYLWLESTLLSVNRSKTPWVIIAGHRPMYYVQRDGSYGPDHTFCAGGEDMEELLLAAGVDLCLWGHVHNALVTCPLRNGTCVSDGAGPVHAVVGNGGQGLSGMPASPPLWMKWGVSAWGWSDLAATPSSLTMNFYTEENNIEYKLFLSK